MRNTFSKTAAAITAAAILTAGAATSAHAADVTEGWSPVPSDAAAKALGQEVTADPYPKVGGAICVKRGTQIVATVYSYRFTLPSGGEVVVSAVPDGRAELSCAKQAVRANRPRTVGTMWRGNVSVTYPKAEVTSRQARALLRIAG